MSGSFYTDNSGRGNYICQDVEETHESTELPHYWLSSKCVGGVGKRMMRDSDLGCHASQLFFFLMALGAIGGFQAGNGNI